MIGQSHRGNSRVPDIRRTRTIIASSFSSTRSFSSVLFKPSHSFHSFILLTNLPTFQTSALDLEPFLPLPRAYTNLPVMFIPFIGIVLASTVSAKVIDIQVGGDGGTLAFSPEAVVSSPYYNLRLVVTDRRSPVRGSR